MRRREGWQTYVRVLLCLSFMWMVILNGCETKEKSTAAGPSQAPPALEVAGFSLTAAANSLIANGVSTTIITATLTDSNAKPSPDDIGVTFTTDKGRFSIDGAKSITQTTSQGTGIVRVTFSSGADTFGTANITAKAKEVTQGPLQITLVPDVAIITLAGPTPTTSLVADGKSFTTITATLKTSADKPAPNDVVVRFDTDKGVFTPDGARSTTAKTSQGTGQASVQWFSEPNVFGTATIAVSAAGVTGVSGSTLITLIGPGPPARITLAADATGTLVSGTTDIKATVLDGQGNKVADGTTVNFTTTLSGSKVTTSATTTNGVATATFTAGTVVGTTGVTATAGSVSVTTPIAILEAVGITLTPKAKSLIANGITSTEITATVLTTTGATAPDGIVISFTTDKGRFTTDGAKSASATIRGGTGTVIVPFSSEQNVVGTANIVASIKGVAQSTQITLTGAGPPNQIILTADTTSISIGGTTGITAQVLDADGNKVVNGTAVSFTTSLTGTGVTSTATTTNGVAVAVFSASTAAGVATVSASAGAASATISITIQPGSAGSLEFVSAVPTVIGIRGSALAQKATLTFRVRDVNGNPVADGTVVTFTLISGVGGDATIAPTTGRTLGGVAATILTSGTVAGPVRVLATVRVGTTTLSSSSTNVSIAGGSPSATHLGIAPQFLNISGQVRQGIVCSVTAVVGDRFGNPVPPNTAVSFVTNGGIIRAQGLTDTLGNATTDIETAAPIPIVDTSPSTGTDARTGFATIIAFTQGEETFADSNGNGLFNTGEPFVDTPEPFVDHVTACTEQVPDGGTRPCQIPADPTLRRALSGNGVLDPTDRFELFFDANTNGVWDGPVGNGVWDADKPIFASTRVLFSGRTDLRVTRQQADGTCQGSPGNFLVPNGGSVSFCVLVSDSQGHPLVGGSKLTVETTAGGIAGTSGVTLPDTQGSGPGITFFTFAVIDKAPELASGTTLANANPPEAAVVSVSVTSPTGTCPGGNGDFGVSFGGLVD